MVGELHYGVTPLQRVRLSVSLLCLQWQVATREQRTLPKGKSGFKDGLSPETSVFPYKQLVVVVLQWGFVDIEHFTA